MEIAANSDARADTTTKSSQHRKDTRRPDIVIYKPGQSRLAKRSEDASSNKTTSGDPQSQSTAVKVQNPNPRHGSKGEGTKQSASHQRGRDKHGGHSTAHPDDRTSTNREHRSSRDDRGVRGSRGGQHSKPRPEPDTPLASEEVTGQKNCGAKPTHDERRAASGAKNEAAGNTRPDVKPETKAVGEQKRWQGPQGKRKNTESHQPLESANGRKEVSESAHTSQTDAQSAASKQSHNWLGKQEHRTSPAAKMSRSSEKPPSDSHRDKQPNQRSPKGLHGSTQPSRSEGEPKRSSGRSSEKSSSKSARPRKPERSFYVSPKLAGSQGQDETQLTEAEQVPSAPRSPTILANPVPAQDTIETMVFTSRKMPNPNWQPKTNDAGSRNAKSQEQFTLENDKKVPLKSLLELQVSPRGKGATSKPPLTEQNPENEARPHTADTRSKAPSSKRYSTKRSRQRYNSESSTGSDNSQLIDAAHPKSVGCQDRELAHADAKLQNLSLHNEFTDSYESVSSTDSGKQKKASQIHNQKEQLNSRTETGFGRRVREQLEPGRQSAERGKLSVTFNSQVREVQLSPAEERDDAGGLGEGPQESRPGERRQGGHSRHRESQRTPGKPEPTQTDAASKGGGLLRLPPKRSDPIAIRPQPTAQQQSEQGYRPIYDRYYAPQPKPAKDEHRPKDPRGRQGNRSLLWDPSKPQEKPALASFKKPESASSDLHFYDPECGGGSPQEHGSDPQGHFQPPGYGAFHPSAYPPMQMQPGMYPPPGFHPAMSWAEQVEAHSPDSRVPAPSPPSQIPNYQGNFPPLGSSPDVPPSMDATSSATTAPSQSQSQLVAFSILQDTVRYEQSINNAVSRRFHGDESVQKIMTLGQELECMYEQVIVTDLETCNKHNVEQLLWKTAYYQLIEALRRQDVEEQGAYKTHLDHLLNHGNDFYVSLLDKLQSAYGFRLEAYTGLDPLHEEPRRTIKLALLSAQRCMISLGDIARYKELTNDTNNFGKARNWYLKAQHLAPRNGRPYNQLAILALYTRRKLDAVYYYMRSLAASNPFLTARESLMSLFEEVRRKVEQKEKAQIQAKQEKERAREEEAGEGRRRGKERGGRRGRPGGKAGGGDDDSRGTTRREIWIASDGSSHDGSELAEDEVGEEAGDEEEVAALRRISPVEINKKFVLSLLNVHGKLFTKIGMEHFGFITDRLLKEFRVLLTHSPTPVTSTRLIQAMAINMFAAHNTETKDRSPREEMRSLLQEQAIQLGLDMFGLLVGRCDQLLTEHLKSATQGRVLLSEDLLQLLPGVKVYADWLMCHPQLWNPPPICTPEPYSASVDVWSCLADFLNTLKRIDTSFVKFVKKADESECQEILLTEDVQLSGFVPLIALPLQPVYVPKVTNKMEAMDCVRIISLLLFGEYACGQETPLLAYDVAKNSYVSVAPETAGREDDGESLKQEGDDVIVEEEYYEEAEGDSGMEAEDSGNVSGLRQKKEDLERRLQQQQQKQAHIEATMESHRRQRGLELEIRPLYLVPDTNCFIDHLTRIQALLACRKYKLVIPLVVINELDGLAKGSRDDVHDEPTQACRVQRGARAAVRCLEEKFEQRNKYLRALTSKGSVMDTIAYRSEEVDFKGCNDDVILKCCLHYVDDRAKDFMPTTKDAPIRLFRDVILLTNDRNLRVKALQQNVPVKDIAAFTKWAKV